MPLFSSQTLTAAKIKLLVRSARLCGWLSSSTMTRARAFFVKSLSVVVRNFRDGPRAPCFPLICEGSITPE